MWLVGTYILVCIASMVLLAFGPNSEGPIGRAHDAVCGCIGRARDGLRRVVGAGCCERLEAVEEYVCWKPNPIIASLYVLVMVVFAVSIVLYIFPFVPSPRIPWLHRPLSLSLVAIGFGLHQWCCYSEPGTITQDNVDMYADNYAFDGLMYAPKLCRTCSIVKPARSKHCAICDRCCAKLDHHCPWLNNCVGALNYRLFLAFLVYHSSLCAYGAVMLARIVGFLAYDEYQLHEAYYTDNQGRHQPVTFWVGLSYIFMTHPAPCCMFIFSTVMGFVLAGFFGALAGLEVARGADGSGSCPPCEVVFPGYHVYLLSTGFTTNESYKWADLKAEQRRQRKLLAQSTKTLAQGEQIGSPAAAAAVVPRPPPAVASLAPRLELVNATMEFEYDFGFWANVMDVLQPIALRTGPWGPLGPAKSKAD